MDFADIAGKYLQNRWDQATQPFDDPEGYMNRRLGIDEEGNVKPRSTTINYNDDGTQTVTTKHDVTPSMYQQPAGGNFQPQPGYNFQMPQAQMPPVQAIEPVQAPVAQPTPAAVPVAPTQPQMMPAGSTNAPFARPLPDTSGVGAGQEIPPGQIPHPIMDDTGRVVGYETPNQTMEALQNKTAFAPQPTVQQPVQPIQPPVVQPPVNVQAPAPVAPVPVAPTTMPVQANVTPPAPVVQERQLEQWQQDLIDAQKDPTKLNAYIANEKNPVEGKTMAENLLKNHYKRQEEEARTEKDMREFIGGDRKTQSDIMRRLSSKSEEGSLLKAYLYNRFGLHELANQEQKKLAGTNFERMMGPDGKPYLAEVNGQGGITGAYDATGKAVGEDVLIKLNSGAISQKQSQAHTGKMRDMTTGQIYYEVTTPGGTRLVSPKGEVFEGDPKNLMVYGVGTELGAAAYKEYNTKAATYNQENVGKGFQPYRWSDGTFRTGPEGDATAKVLPDGRILDWKTYGDVTGSSSKKPEIKTPTPTGKQKVSFEGTTTPGMMNTVAPVAPTQQPIMQNAIYRPEAGATTWNDYANPNLLPENQPQGGMIKTQYLPSPAEQKVQREVGKEVSSAAGKGEVDIGVEGRKDIVKKASDVIGTAPIFLDRIDTVNEGIAATKKKNNLGTIAEGVLPGERFVGKYIMSSQDQRNTDKALAAVKTIAVDGMKALGANPTDTDRDYLTANIPDETWADKDVRDWLESRKKYILRKVEIAKKQIETGGRYTPEMPKETKSGLNAKDQAALEWANAHPKDPRAKTIKEQLGVQ